MDEGFGMLLVGIILLVMLAVTLVLIGIGIILALAVLVIAGILVLTGIATTSALVAFFQRRVSHGIIVFLTQLGAVSGLPVGITIALFFDWLTGWSIDGFLAAAFGAFVGLVIGSLIGVLSSLVLIRIYHWLTQHIHLPRRDSNQLYSQP